MTLTSLLTGDLLPRDLSFRSLLHVLLLLLLLLFLHDGCLLPLLQLSLLLLGQLSLHFRLRDPITLAGLPNDESVVNFMACWTNC